MIPKLLLFLFVSITPFFLYSQELGAPFITNFSPKEYEFSPQNLEIIKDKRGLIFIANVKGIMEYDGQTWRKIYIENEFGVKSLCMDKRGTVFVGGVGSFGFLEADSKGKFVYKSISNQLDSTILRKPPNIWKVRIVNDIVYFNAFDAIYKYSIKEKSTTVWRPKKRFLLSQTLNDKFYVIAQSQGLLVNQNDSLILIKEGEKLKKDVVFGMQNYDDKIIMALRNKLIIYDEAVDITKGNSCFTDFKTEADSIFKKSSIYSLIALPRGRYAIATRGLGVVILNKKGKIIDWINDKTKLIDNKVWSINYFDDVLWIATNKGYAIAEINSPFRSWEIDKNISGNTRSIIRFNDKLHLASTGGISALDKTQTMPRFVNIDNYTASSWDFINLKTALKPTILAATSKGLVQISKQGIIKKVTRQVMYSLLSYPENENIYFVGGRKSVFIMQYFPKTDSWEFEEISGLDGEIRSMVMQDNTLWIGTFYNGVFKVNFNKKLDTSQLSESDYTISQLDSTSGFSGKIDPMIYTIDSQTIITTPDGIYEYSLETNKLKRTEKFGFYFKTHGAYRFITNNKKQIWVGNKGLLTKENNKYVLDSVFLKRLPLRSVSAVYFDQSNNSWYLGGSDGHLFRYKKEDDKVDYQQKFNALIRKVKIKGDSVIFNGAFNFYDEKFKQQVALEKQTVDAIPSIKYEYNTLNFDFSCNFYVAINEIEYTYKLEGFDEEWSNYSKKTDKEYTNLAEGKYSFQVKAKNIYDNESQIATYKFEILAPWYRTWWAYIFYVISAAVFVFLIVRLNIHRLKQAKLKLEQTIDQRTAEIQSQKKLIERKNKQITKSIQAAKRIQEATFPQREVMQNYLETFFILFMPRDIVSGDFYWCEKKNDKIILALADCTGHGISGAFMSLIGTSLLREVVLEKSITQPSKILSMLRKGVIESLHQSGKIGETQEGIDISLCSIDYQNNILEFAGAFQTMIHIRQDKITFIKGDKQPVGIYGKKTKNEFTNHSISIQKGDLIYLFTDGFQDQFGGRHDRRFTSQRLKKLIFENKNVAIESQKDIFMKELSDWKGTQKQIDDISLIGFRI